MSDSLVFSQVSIAVVGFSNGKARQILLTKEQRELVKALIELMHEGKCISMSSIELPLACEEAR